MTQIIESQLVGGKQDGYFTSVVVNLNSGHCRDCRAQIQQAVTARLKLGASKLQLQRLNRSATLLPFQELLYRMWVKLPTRLNILLEYH